MCSVPKVIFEYSPVATAIQTGNVSKLLVCETMTFKKTRYDIYRE